MIRKILREYYLLSRGEQRALILLSLLVILTFGTRLLFWSGPGREPAGLDQFQREARTILAAFDELDSLKHASFSQGSLPGGSRKVIKGQSQPKLTAEWKITPINLNESDSASLLPLPGVGPVFAGRIVRYRNLLGGFVQAEQLLEVYGIERETFQRISPHLFIDSTLVQKLDLNSAGFRELLRHPYLEYVDVKALVHYRDVIGHISSLDELRQNMILPDSVMEKVAPYLDPDSVGCLDD